MLGALLRSVKVSVREASAFARQATLLRHDTGAPVVPRDVLPGADVVVVLHGLFASAGVLRPLRAHLDRRDGIHTATLSYAPGRDADEVARALDALLDELPAHAHIHLCGHSFGGVIARFVAVRRSDPRIVQTIALASPFGGIRGATLVALGGVRDLEPDSELLRTVRVARPERPIPHLSVIAGSDVLVSPPLSHALPDGELVVLPERGHNTLLFDRECIGLVEDRVLAARRSRREAASAADPAER